MMNNAMKQPIEASDEAIRYLQKKIAFFRRSKRVPKIVLTERSCSGATFRLFFDLATELELKLQLQDIELLVDASVLQAYGGFRLELEYFFFARRLKIIPRQQSYQCDCKNKCDKAVDTAANEV